LVDISCHLSCQREVPNSRQGDAAAVVPSAGGHPSDINFLICEQIERSPSMMMLAGERLRAGGGFSHVNLPVQRNAST
jgi:hypothetical protein